MPKGYSIVESSESFLFVMEDNDFRMGKGDYTVVDRVERFNKREGKISTVTGKNYTVFNDWSVKEIAE